jgi:hypothetical protein
MTAPNAREIEPSTSERSRNGNEFFFANAAFAVGGSREIPRTTTFFFS